jgi:hypothetical protein
MAAQLPELLFGLRLSEMTTSSPLRVNQFKSVLHTLPASAGAGLTAPELRVWSSKVRDDSDSGKRSKKRRRAEGESTDAESGRDIPPDVESGSITGLPPAGSQPDKRRRAEAGGAAKGAGLSKAQRRKEARRLQREAEVRKATRKLRLARVARRQEERRKRWEERDG